MKDREIALNYVIYDSSSDITLDLFEAERYDSALIVQQLVGNLVYYSNDGRYEPRLAKKWQRVTPSSWHFEIRDNLICENKEIITASKFKESLQRSIKKIASRGMIPVLNKLKGYEDFLKKGGDLSGLKAEKQILKFEFKEPVRSGLAQVLSFVPFGYICKDNLNEDGTWKDKQKFISSGPYKVKRIELGKKYHLIKNDDWHIESNNNSPTEIIFTHSLNEKTLTESNLIIDTVSKSFDSSPHVSEYKLVPEYLNSILLGNLKEGFFADINNRLLFRDLLNKNKSVLPEKWGVHIRSDAFYPNQQLSSSYQNASLSSFTKQNQEIVIEGSEPKLDDEKPRSYAWKVLKLTLEEANLKYRFANNEPSWKEGSDPSYDIRIRGTSIGGGIEVWGLGIVFCSELGVRFPDPTGEVCKMVKDYELDKITFEELKNKFFKTIEADSAILPISHFGSRLFLSKEIDRKTISPALNVIKFDQLGVIN